MPFRDRLWYILDVAILGMAVFQGTIGNTSMAVAGIGVYLLGGVLENIAIDIKHAKQQ